MSDLIRKKKPREREKRNKQQQQQHWMGQTEYFIYIVINYYSVWFGTNSCVNNYN